jgi:hypothetical protein
MLKITTYVMKFLRQSRCFAADGFNGIHQWFRNLGRFCGAFMVDFYLALISLWLVLIFAGFLFLGPRIRLLLLTN